MAKAAGADDPGASPRSRRAARAAYADFVLHLPAQTMADDQGDAKTSVLPMGVAFEGALFVLFEVMMLKLKAPAEHHRRGDARQPHQSGMTRTRR